MTEHDTLQAFLDQVEGLPENDQAKRILAEARKSIHGNPGKAKSFAEHVKDYIGDEVIQCRALLVIAEALFEQGHYTQAYDAYQRCADENERLGFPIAKGTLQNWQGLSLWRKGDLEGALEALYSAMRYFEEQNAEEQLANAENNIGLIYWDLKMDDEALRHYLKSMKIKEKIGDNSGMWALNNNIAGVYYRKGDIATAIKYMEPVIEYFKNSERYRQFAQISTNKAILMIEMKRFDEARDILEKVHEITVERNCKFEQVLCLTTTGDLAARTDQPQKAEEAFMEAIRIGREIESKELVRKAMGHQARYYERFGEYEKALPLFKDLSQLKDELFHEQFAGKIAELESKFESEKKEKEMEIYRLRNIELVRKNEEIERRKAELEETLSQLQKAQEEIIELEKQKSVWAMAVTANHEINQPLMVIRGNMDLLRMKMTQTALSVEHEQYIENIEKSIERIGEVLRKFKEQYPIRFTEYGRKSKMVVFNESRIDND